MPTTIHIALAAISAVTTALVAVEAVRRAIGDIPSSSVARWLAAAQFGSLLLTAIAGFALVASGVAAHNGLHYLLAVVALLSVPAAPMFSPNSGPRRRALVTCVAALVALTVVALLFTTG
jgi:hypothetical protein